MPPSAAFALFDLRKLVIRLNKRRGGVQMGNLGAAQMGKAVPSPEVTQPTQVAEREYARRLDKRVRQLAGIRLQHQWLWTYMIVTVVGALLIVFATLAIQSVSGLWILLPSVLALTIFQLLARNARAHGVVQRIITFYELGIARLQGKWRGLGISGEEFRPVNHPYASDLDLFGVGSLFEFLCTARTGVGRAKLAEWLLNTCDCAEASERQRAVKELSGMPDLREAWASAGGNTLDQVSSSALKNWAAAPCIAYSFRVEAFAIALPACLIVLSVLAHVGIFGHHWLWVVALPVALEAFLAALLLKKNRLITANLVRPSFELGLLVPLLARLEGEDFHSPLLNALQSKLSSFSGRSSEQIRILNLWAWLLDLRQSEYFALPASLFLWGTNCAIRIERWRQRNQEGLLAWLESLGQFEALLCLAGYAYENPDNTFPVLKPESSSLFHAQGLGHPLLDRGTCIRCDISLDAEATQLIVVSGSNMSGKSTLLRSVGVNAVLAFAGAPVRAARLVISPLRIGCTISVHDSFVQAKSRFEAEVDRLKEMLNLARTENVLFLLDEVLGGTNSTDRLEGTRAMVEQFAGHGAIGLMTTHDLALVEVVKPLDGRAINVHFEEHYENGEMRFDYRMHHGVLANTNGSNVLAALGLLPCSQSMPAKAAISQGPIGR